jgi:sucrose-phosphate synthase
LPIVATENGGPVDIIKNCKNGELIDPLDKPGITEALLKILLDKDLWKEYVKSGLKGVKQHYSWQAHVSSYIEKINELSSKHNQCRQKE